MLRKSVPIGGFWVVSYHFTRKFPITAIQISAGRTHCVEITSSGDGIMSEDNLIREIIRSINPSESI